ncbi:MAG TPA: DNA-processing protein DprA [Bacteroidota bacterium]|nr:DNA-processing protein DprA [Bacteroidota bacterium]
MNVRDLLHLASVPRIGPLKIRSLIAHFGTPTEVLKATARDLVEVPGIDKKLASHILHHKDGQRLADEQLKRLNKIGGRIVTLWDKEYPSLLKKIYDPPAFLFVLGKFTKQDETSLAIVGTRHPSAYGQQVAERLSRELAKLGITTVSGLARGVDTVVHSTTIKAGGRTIAVIGSGLDVPYPPENKKLQERIAEEGAVVSEFLMGAKPDAPNFPRRNRIISGLSLGTIIVESAEDGGAMITASTALDQNREVFAIPGLMTEKRSAGPHKLIKEGRAKLITSIDDVLEELQPLRSLSQRKEQKPEPRAELTLFEQKIFDVLQTEPIHIDTIAELANVSPTDALVNLLSLEFKGVVRQLPGKFFTRT